MPRSARTAALVLSTVALLDVFPGKAEVPPGTWPGKLTFADDGEHDTIELVVSREGDAFAAVLKHGDKDHVLKKVRNSPEGLTFSWGQDRCTLLPVPDEGGFRGPCRDASEKVTVEIETFPQPAAEDPEAVTAEVEEPAAVESPAAPERGPAESDVSSAPPAR